MLKLHSPGNNQDTSDANSDIIESRVCNKDKCDQNFVENVSDITIIPIRMKISRKKISNYIFQQMNYIYLGAEWKQIFKYYKSYLLLKSLRSVLIIIEFCCHCHSNILFIPVFTFLPRYRYFFLFLCYKM